MGSATNDTSPCPRCGIVYGSDCGRCGGDGFVRHKRSRLAVVRIPPGHYVSDYLCKYCTTKPQVWFHTVRRAWVVACVNYDAHGISLCPDSVPVTDGASRTEAISAWNELNADRLEHHLMIPEWARDMVAGQGKHCDD